MHPVSRTRISLGGAPALFSPLLEVDPSLAWWEPTALGLVIYLAAAGVAIALFRRARTLRRRARGRQTRAVARR